MLATPWELGDRLANRIARSPITIGQASPAEMEVVGDFRYRVYIEQSGKNAEYADHIKRTLLEPLDATSVNLIARIANGHMVGTVRISRASDGWHLPDRCQQVPWPWLPSQSVACVSRLMVDREFAPLMTMPALFAECFRWGLANSIRLCAVFCAPALKKLFESYGCQQFDYAYRDPFVGEQLPMLCCLRDSVHLKSIGSPFTNFVGDRRANPKDIAYMRSLLSKFNG